MLLVHGVQDHCHSWDWFADAFADRYHVLAPDLRGHGDAAWVRGSSYHHLDYLYDLDQLVRQRGLMPSILISHSMGGTLASMLPGGSPGWCWALVIIQGVGLGPGSSDAQPTHARLHGSVRGTRQLPSRQPRRCGSLEGAYKRMQKANPR